MNIGKGLTRVKKNGFDSYQNESPNFDIAQQFFQHDKHTRACQIFQQLVLIAHKLNLTSWYEDTIRTDVLIRNQSG